MSHATHCSPRWLSHGTALVVGLVLSVAVLAALVWVAWNQREEILRGELEHEELLARVLEDHATRTIETASLALGALGELLSKESAADGLEQCSPMLSQALLGLPFVRSLAVVDLRGRVLASTSTKDLGALIDLAALGRLPEEGKDALGASVPGRSLEDISADTSRATQRLVVGFIPLVRSLALRDGRQVLLVALLNPGAFVNFQHLSMDGASDAAALATYEGRILAASGDGLGAGLDVSAHPVFRKFLPAHEHGTYIGAGLRTDQQINAFRVSRSRPVVLITERPYAVVIQRWWVGMRWLAAAGLVAVTFIALMSWAAWRSLKSREQARRQLDAAQENVARSERELSVLVKSVQELIFRTDVTGAVIFVNARWHAVSGHATQQVLGRPLCEVVQSAYRDIMAALFLPEAPGSGVRTAQAAISTPGGGARLFDFAVVPLRAKGMVVGYAGSAVDVTERWAAQQKLQAQLGFSALLLETSPLPVSMTDTRGRYLSVNRAWEEFTGHARGDVLGKRGVDFMTFEEAALHAREDDDLLARGGRMRYEARVKHRDTSRRDIVATKVAVPGPDGKTAGVLCTVMDVSEFRDAERASREARDEAEEASRTKSEFIANVSHELRTPLQVILGFSELGLTRLPVDARVRELFQDIHTSGQRMLALVNDLLDVSKLESPVGTLHLERTDLRGLVRAVARELDPLLAARQQRVELQLSDMPLVAKVDPPRFQQVIRNVLGNAIKFSPQGHPIQLTGVVTGAGELHFSIRDQGPGIPAAELGKIFDAFVQSSLTKDGSGGTGLGLAICRRIMEAHGGSIHAENLNDRGSAFHIRLPARGFADTAPAAAF